MADTGEFAGQTILVTGAGSGIGAATALMLAGQGALIGVLDQSLDRCRAICAQITGAGGAALPLVADVADDHQMQQAVAALAATGRIDGLVVCAGINGTWAPVDDLTPAEWDQTIAVNLRGTFLALHYTVPHLKLRGGAVVIISSVNGVRTFTTAGAVAYAASKAAQVAVAQQLALELALHKIRVNVVCPGFTQTSIGHTMVNRNTNLAAYPATYPKGDVPLTGAAPAQPRDIAETVTFLMSDRARFVTGTALIADGGQSVLR